MAAAPPTPSVTGGIACWLRHQARKGDQPNAGGAPCTRSWASGQWTRPGATSRPTCSTTKSFRWSRPSRASCPATGWTTRDRQEPYRDHLPQSRGGQRVQDTRRRTNRCDRHRRSPRSRYEAPHLGVVVARRTGRHRSRKVSYSAHPRSSEPSPTRTSTPAPPRAGRETLGHEPHAPVAPERRRAALITHDSTAIFC
jgi:hypothetical protein